MTATYQVRLECDEPGCEQQFVGNGSAMSVREQSWPKGWNMRGIRPRGVYRDYCPQHSALAT